MELGTLILQFPFLLSLLAGMLAGLSAVLLRRAALVLGSGLRWLAWLLTACSVAAAALSFVWSWSLYQPPAGSGNPLLTALGGLLGLAGVLLTLRALSVRGLRELYTWPAAKLENRSPYRQVRRPIGLGLMMVALGATLVVDTFPAWVCFFVWLILTHLQLEVEEWEMRHRLPGARDYLKRTPRYIPRFRHKERT